MYKTNDIDYYRKVTEEQEGLDKLGGTDRK